MSHLYSDDSSGDEAPEAVSFDVSKAVIKEQLEEERTARAGYVALVVDDAALTTCAE